MNESKPFPAFASLAEAEAYSEKVGDAYFEICYHLEGKLNLCLATMHDLYVQALPTKRPKMQTGLVREWISPQGWPKHQTTLVQTLAALGRFRQEDTCHASTVNEAMTALALEKEVRGASADALLDRTTLEAMTPADADKARGELLRLCDWIESRFHYLTQKSWYEAPDCFSDDPARTHLADIGFAERHLAKFSERDQKRWADIHARAAAKHQDDLKMWGTVGKVQHDPQPRTWTHPDVDARIISLWPLVLGYNWTYPDLLKVLEQLLPLAPGGHDRRYPLDSVESLKVHCRAICGLTKTGQGRSAPGLPSGWPIAQRLFPRLGK